MSEELLKEARRWAFRELNRRDGMGTVLKLNYEQMQHFKREDHVRLRPILEKQLRTYKRSLWWMGIGIPIALMLVVWWQETPALAWVLTLFFVGELAFLLEISLPRIAAMERARVLFDFYDGYVPASLESGVHAEREEV